MRILFIRPSLPQKKVVQLIKLIQSGNVFKFPSNLANKIFLLNIYKISGLRKMLFLLISLKKLSHPFKTDLILKTKLGLKFFDTKNKTVTTLSSSFKTNKFIKKEINIRTALKDISLVNNILDYGKINGLYFFKEPLLSSSFSLLDKKGQIINKNFFLIFKKLSLFYKKNLKATNFNKYLKSLLEAIKNYSTAYGFDFSEEYFFRKRVFPKKIYLTTVHGDLVPANILKQNKIIKLIDWSSSGTKSITYDFYSLLTNICLTKGTKLELNDLIKAIFTKKENQLTNFLNKNKKILSSQFELKDFNLSDYFLVYLLEQIVVKIKMDNPKTVQASFNVLKKSLSLINKDILPKERKIFLLHNVVAPYRLPLFSKLGQKHNLTVFFCRRKETKRKWKVSLFNLPFNNKVLLGFKLGFFYINPTLFFELLLNKYDLYIVGENPSNIFSTLTVLLISKLFKKPFIIWSEETEEANKFRLLKRTHLKKILIKAFINFIKGHRKIIYPQADAFIALSQKAKKFLIKTSVPKNKVFAGIQIMPKNLLLPPLVKKSQIKFKNKIVVFSLGYLIKRKGINILIKAFKQINKKNVVLIIGGSGPEGKKLKLLAKDNENIIFTGHLNKEKKAKYYSLADIFVLPTFYDAWGLVINEAMYYQLPIITTRAAGATQLIKNNKNGFVIKTGSVQQLKRALEKLLNNKALRDKMGKCSRKYFDKYNTLQKGIDPFLKAINFCLNDLSNRRYSS